MNRTELLLGEDAKKLKNSSAAIFGLGGVGGYCAEFLARAGVGRLALADSDSISESNLNRQVLALSSTVGRKKTSVCAERIGQINGEIKVEEFDLFYDKNTPFDFSAYDIVLDCIDTVTSKVALALACRGKSELISCMGTGNKLDPTAFRVAPLEQSSVCPLARGMRRELKKRNVTGVKAVWSTEEARNFPQGEALETKGTAGRIAPGSVAFVPSVAGLILAGEIVKDLLAGTGGKEHG